MDLKKLNSALDNDNNENIFGLTTKKILEMNLKILILMIWKIIIL